MENHEKLHNIRHTLAHLLAMAAKEFDPTVKLGIGPVTDDGFYYDFQFTKAPTAENLKDLEKTMRKLVNKKLPMKGREIDKKEGEKLFAGQPFKLELLSEYATEGKTLTTYTIDLPAEGPAQTGEFTDLCKGGHVENTGEIPVDCFKLTRIAGAYWRGSEKNPMLTRIYGYAFLTGKELDDHLKMLEEAKKRDHKKLGKELDLFTFSDLVGAGLPLWTPKGTLVRNLLDNYVWELRKVHGYEKVEIPHITKKELYITSGHWDKFKDELFRITTREGHEFAMKPMNCPHHTQIYARKPWSYRELPQRYASTTKVYRDEQTGELAGLSRVRAITQDDAHVFCRFPQAKEEMVKIWDIVTEFYKAAGFKLEIRLSLHDPKHMEKYLGSEELWQKAENQLREIIKSKKAKAIEAEGEAAFYGPKIDFMAKDSIGREWQVATIQLDMNLPERFDLTCINEKGERERIAMIHAAIMGSIERYLSVLIEHFAGAFPIWLSPVQTVVIPVSEKFEPYAIKVSEKIREEGIRLELDLKNESVGKKIREAELQKIPYILVVGEKEQKSRSVAVRQRSKGDLGPMKLDKFVENIKKEITEKK